MTMQSLIQTVLSVPLFHGLKARQIVDMANASERVIYHPGDTIAQRQMLGQASVIIVSGTAVRVNGPDMVGSVDRLPQRSDPEMISPGSMIGELAMFIDVEHLSTVLAQTEVRALRLTQPMMHHLMERDAELADHFVTKIAQQLTAMSQQMKAIDNALGQTDQLQAASHQTGLGAVADAMRDSEHGTVPPRLH